jgi:predicted ATP-dependent endonuclease of OLD family
MFAIGASAFSMVPTRKVVLAEGASECILLPSLLRTATEREELTFQVAPGLASVAPNDVPDLDMEAPRVAFIVDGDSGGREIITKLKKGGFSEDQVVRLADGHVLEDYVHLDTYVAGVNEELRRSFNGQHVLQSGDLPQSNRPLALKNWCDARGVKPPKRVAVAERIIENQFSLPLIDETLKSDLVRCHDQLVARL